MSESNFWNDERVEDFFIKLSNQKFYHFGIKTYIDEYKKSKSEHKDYEILSVIHNDGTGKMNPVDMRVFPESNWEKVLKYSPIHSVLRKSDGEVFSVGDDTNLGKITRFEVLDGEMFVSFTKDNFPYPTTTWGRTDLKSISKVKQPIPLLTIEDIESCTQRIEVNGYSIGFLNEDKLKELAKSKHK